MRRIPLLIAVAAVLPGIALDARGQSPKTTNTLQLDAKENTPRARIADAAWLQGHWIGEGLGGTVEEVWAPPLGNSMMGMFRLVKNGKVVFSEIFFLVEEDDSLVLKLKHFDANLKGWEEREASVKFPLVKLAPNEAFFSGLTYRKPDDGTLSAFVAITPKRSGEVKEEAFRFRRHEGLSRAEKK